MIKKIELSEEIKNKIILLNNEGKSLRYISNQINFSTSKITNFLKEINEYKYIEESKVVNIKKINEGFDYVAICPLTKMVFTDFLNRSGYLTTHIKKYRPKIIIPSNFLRKDYFIKNGIYWHEQYFDFIEKDLLIKEVVINKKNNFIVNKKIKKNETFVNNINIGETQLKINNFLIENNVVTELNYKINDTKVDIFCTDLKIGIIINNNFNSTQVTSGKNKNHHLEKTKIINKNGYKLIQIFEDELTYKKEIVYSKISSIFNIRSTKEKIYARKCVIKEILKPNEKRIFLDKNHIQGNDNSNIYLGAYFNDKLISVMTFDNKRTMNGGNDNLNNYELKRFATDNDYHIIGIGSKLLNYFIVNYKPTNILSFADRRWTLNKDDNLYVKLGFKLTKTLLPTYTYYNIKVIDNIRYHKFKFGKNSIKSKFPNFYDENKTEREMMFNIGYDRIWDCGMFRYELKIKN